ncbi:RDD family protein [Neorhodopirellula pilleata]|uniref:RDD family protein n=1 Tax=Neorhodopirellula pilleata TaxID=2714738 RepID=A0A5C5ZZA8_9BACT|nr:RDD family protein [Neorhodopirellula pilleata]TWT91663.1 RDD family protein [Neorhodopirellula pilleata]
MSPNPYQVENSNATPQNPYQTPSEAGFVLPHQSADEAELAGRMNRLGAAMLDGIISLAVMTPILWFTGYLTRAMGENVTLTELILQSIGGMVIFLLIQGYFLANRGQTLGKMAAGIRIVSVQDGRLVPFGKLIGLRYLPLWLLQVIPFANFLGLIDALFIFRQDRRCVHDLLAGTKVVNV